MRGARGPPFCGNFPPTPQQHARRARSSDARTRQMAMPGRALVGFLAHIAVKSTTDSCMPGPVSIFPPMTRTNRHAVGYGGRLSSFRPGSPSAESARTVQFDPMSRTDIAILPLPAYGTSRTASHRRRAPAGLRDVPYHTRTTPYPPSTPSASRQHNDPFDAPARSSSGSPQRQSPYRVTPGGVRSSCGVPRARVAS